MHNFDLNLLRIFAALWQHRHVGRAAAALELSQPNFSYSLKKLRDQLGDPLFLKTRSGMQPTAAATQLAPVVANILAQVSDQLLTLTSFEPASSSRTFVLSLSDLGEMVFLPKLLRRLAVIAPQVSIRTVGGRPTDLQQAMENGELDLLMGHFPDTSGSNMFQQRLFSHGFLCLARKAHPLIGKKLTRQTFLSLPHAVIRSETRSQEIVEEYFKAQGIKRRVPLQTRHFLSIPFVVAASDIIVTVPAAVGEMFSEIAAIQTFKPPLPFPRFDIKQYWHRRQHDDAANRWLRGVVHQLFSGRETWRITDDSKPQNED
jgi:DNA-binding transcriptional LysR family regulator